MRALSKSFLLLLAGCTAGCSAGQRAHRAGPVTPTDEAPSRRTANPLVVPLVPLGGNEAVDLAFHRRLAASPHNYFRAINAAFARETCLRFEGVMGTLPTVVLHGDAHLEQVAVTSHGPGLSDFDDSGSGPPVLDLVRFGSSIALAAQQRGWPMQPHVAAFLNAYERQVQGYGNRTPNPPIFSRMAEDFSPSRTSFLDDAVGRMLTPLPMPNEEAEAGYARYVALMLRVHPEKSEDFFQIKRWGIPRQASLGSAQTKRLLIRIEGATPNPDDDWVLEAKEMRDVSSIPCIEGRRGQATGVVASAVRFGARPDPFLALIPRSADEAVDDLPWWVQSWWSNYAEVDIDTLTSEQDLADVAEFAAYQLARGHTAYLSAPDNVQLQVVILGMMREHRRAIETSIDELTTLTLDAYENFLALEAENRQRNVE